MLSRRLADGLVCKVGVCNKSLQTKFDVSAVLLHVIISVHT